MATQVHRLPMQTDWELTLPKLAAQAASLDSDRTPSSETEDRYSLRASGVGLRGSG